MKVLFTEHALFRMSLRRVSKRMARETLANPQRSGMGYKGRLLAFKAFQEGTVKVVYKVKDGTTVVISVMWE